MAANKKPVRARVVSELYSFKYLQRKRRRFSGDVSRDNDRGTEFSNCAGKCQYDPRNDATRSKRKRNGKKDAHVAGAKCLRDLFQSLIHALETNARRTDQKRKRHHRGRDNNSAPRENNVDPQMFV